ncbi:MAG: hypothetical protein ACXABK_04205 [Candidatus Heimdallarchaeaceae archaeon]|jgi:hypothetical protein
MSSYLSFIRDKLISEKERKIPQVVILGLVKSGKSSVINRLLYGTVSDAQPTQATCFINVAYGKSILTIIEADEETARESPYFIDILSEIDVPESIPFPDLLQDPAFQVIMDDINRSVSIYPVSVRTGENFYTAFDWIISRITGRTPLREEVTPKRVIILQEGGVPVFDYTFDATIEEHDSTLLGGLISALNIMATTIFESESVMDVVKLGGVKMVIRKLGNWSIVLFVDRNDSESKAQSLAEEILSAFIEEKERDPTKEMPRQMKYEILTKIPEIAILLDQQPSRDEE